MIFGGTAVQTVILAIITMKSDWDKEVINQGKQQLNRVEVENSLVFVR